MIRELERLIRKMNQYRFDHSWHFNAAPEFIWNELMNISQWPRWCPTIETIQPLGRSRQLRIGNQIRTTWKGSLPYSITFDCVVTAFTTYDFISFTVHGDLAGNGICHFTGSKENTAVQFIWDVAPTRLWIRMSAPFARPVFIGNHNYIMDEMARGFARRIDRAREKPIFTRPGG